MTTEGWQDDAVPGRTGDELAGEPDAHALARDLVAAREAQLRAMAEASRLSERLDGVEAAQPGLVRAVQAVTRQCEAARRAAVPGLPEWFMRTEAIDVASQENLRPDEIRFLAYAEGAAFEVVSRAERTAGDALRALGSALALDPREARPVDLVEVWGASERSNMVVESRRDADQVEAERAAEAVLPLLDGLARDPTPGGAAEVFRRMLAENRFRARVRMAYVLAPLVVRLGFRAPNSFVGLSRHLPKPDILLQEAERPDTFQRVFHKAATDAAERTTRAAVELAGVREGLRSRLGHERATSRTGGAVDAFLRRPVMNVPGLAQELGSTRKGAQLILDRLVAAGIVQALDTSRSKGRLYVCRRAVIPA